MKHQPVSQPDLAAYAGRWVALVRGRVVGVGLTPEEARLVAKRNRPKEEPTLQFVESKEIAINPHSRLFAVAQLLHDAKTPAYLVGGAVRDLLLTSSPSEGKTEMPPFRPSLDLDFAVPGDALRIARRLADALGGAFYPLDAKRDVGRVVLTQDGRQEPRIIDVARFQGPDLMADLAGRDFTINAMALDVMRAPPALIDPHHGQADLQARQLRAVSNQSIADDPVRGLRAVRIGAQLGFEIEPQTQGLIRAAASGLGEISAERVRDELVKILSQPAVTNLLRQLDDLNLLVEILPEVTALKGVAQSKPHRWDVYQHSLQTVAALETLLPLNGMPPHKDVPFADQVTKHLSIQVAGGHSLRLLLTLAALLHDVGKPNTATTEADGRIRFIDHERVGAEMAAVALRRLRFSGEAIRRVERIVRHHLRPLQLAWQGRASRRSIHRFFKSADNAGVDIALLSIADHLATVGPGDQDERYDNLLDVVENLLDAYFHQQEKVVSPPPLLKGQDLKTQFGLAEGPGMGRLLAALQEAQAVGQVTNRRQAEAWVRGKIAEWRLETGD